MADAADVMAVSGRFQWHGGSAAGVDGVGAASREMAAVDARRRATGPGPEWCRGVRRGASGRGPGCRRSGRGCRDARARRRWPRRVPVSTTSPAYMTTTRVAMRATMPRSCVISTSPMANSRCNSASRCRICAWMVTSSAVVGSSARISAGRAHQRHGDHHALAQAAGELVGILLEPARRGRDADAIEQVDGALAACRRDTRRGAAAPPRSWLPMV